MRRIGYGIYFWEELGRIAGLYVSLLDFRYIYLPGVGIEHATSSFKDEITHDLSRSLVQHHIKYAIVYIALALRGSGSPQISVLGS